tara:strand:+ start:329 stop:1186 length:858 start_codon:yes stop_codon:yes gene_type:complete
MAILISGSSGFLGKKLLNYFKKKFNYKIYVISNRKKNIDNYINVKDINNVESIKKYKNKIKFVIHLATKYSNEKTNEEEIYKVNYLYSIKVYEFSKKINSKYFLNICTTLNPSINYYAYTKNLFKEYLKSDKQKKIRVVNCKLDMIFGYNDKRFFHNFVNQLLNKEKIKLTNCNQLRNITYVDDILEQFLILIKNIHLIKKNNIKMGVEFEIRMKTFIFIICKEINKKLENNPLSKLDFGALPERKDERIFKMFSSENIFNKYKKKQLYLKKLKEFIQFELDKFV